MDIIQDSVDYGKIGLVDCMIVDTKEGCDI